MAEKEYIEREAARLAYEKSLANDNHRIEGASAIHRREHRYILHILEKLPAADVVEVVRCKDCKHRNPNGWKCLRDNLWHNMDDFCNYGERKEQT